MVDHDPDSPPARTDGAECFGCGRRHPEITPGNLCAACSLEVRVDTPGRRPTPEKPPELQDRMLQFFEYKHLPEKLQRVSRPFGELARQIVLDLPANPERTVALRKLLEAKDCAVRALLYQETAR